MPTQCTPGPWRRSGFRNLSVMSAAGYTIVACPGSDTGTPSEIEANTRLIAAAPLLYEACCDDVNDVESHVTRLVEDIHQGLAQPGDEQPWREIADDLRRLLLDI